MPHPDDTVDEDIVVRGFSGRFLIWRFHAERKKLLGSSPEGLGTSDDLNKAIAKAFELAGRGHSVWFCETHERAMP